MAEVLKVDNQECLEALQREAEELKKRLEEEKAKLKDVDSVYIKKTSFFSCNAFRFSLLPEFIESVIGSG